MKIKDIITENLRDWFGKEKWVRFGPDGRIRGDCARGSSKEGKPKCLPAAKAHALGKKGRASAAAKKRREDPNPERRGPAKNVATRVKEAVDRYELKITDQWEDEDPESYGMMDEYEFDVLKNGQSIGRARANNYFADLYVDLNNGKHLKLSHQKHQSHPLMKEYERLVWGLDEQGVAESSVDNNTKLSWVAKKLASETVIPGDRKDFLKAAKRFDRGYTTGGMDIINDMDTDPRDDFFNYCDHYGAVYEQGVAGVSYPEVLYHGSTQEIKGPLTPRQANDIGGHPGSNKNAIYATDDPNFAIAYSLAERGSDTGTFGWKKEPRLIFFGGKIRHGKDVYIHVLPTRDEQGRPLFTKGGADAEWYSVPGVTAITPIKVITEPVDRYLHLLRKPTPEEQKIFQANKAKAKQGVAEGIPFDQCPSCGGKIVHESELTEKQDACYHKVRSRYKVWPSAYASGALVQCRKKGAANWGNKSKK